MPRQCLGCDLEISERGLFRIRIGGILYDEQGVKFSQSQDDYFGDHTSTKWLCNRCAEERSLYINELGTEKCLAPECGTICDQTFEPVTSLVSESVLLIEWGRMCPSLKAGGEAFQAEYQAHVHYNCACDGFDLPLWNISPQDEPG
jgi:hypothetical protein